MSSTDPLRILLVDDHPAFRRGLRAMLTEEDEIYVLGEAGSGEEAVALVDRLRPEGLDLVLMDVDMQGIGGVEATRQIVQEYPDLPVVMLTASGLEEDLFQAMEAGALGYLTKDIGVDAMVRSLRDYHRDGSLLMSRTMAARVLRHFRQTDAPFGQMADHPSIAQSAPSPAIPDRLSTREREVAALVARGWSDSQIAEELTLSVKTAKKHVQNIRQKLGLPNRVQLAKWFWDRHG